MASESGTENAIVFDDEAFAESEKELLRLMHTYQEMAQRHGHLAAIRGVNALLANDLPGSAIRGALLIALRKLLGYDSFEEGIPYGEN